MAGAQMNGLSGSVLIAAEDEKQADALLQMLWSAGADYLACVLWRSSEGTLVAEADAG